MAFWIALTTARSNISHISKTARDCEWQFSHLRILPSGQALVPQQHGVLSAIRSLADPFAREFMGSAVTDCPY